MGRRQRPNSVKGDRYWCRRRRFSGNGWMRPIVIFELWGLDRGKRPPHRLRKRYGWKEPEIDP